MCTSVPQTPARRTRMSTSFSRIVGSATSFRTNPGAAVSFTSAFTRDQLLFFTLSRAARPVPARIETSHRLKRDGSLTTRARLLHGARRRVASRSRGTPSTRARYLVCSRTTRTPIACENCGSYIRVQHDCCSFERGYCVELPQRRCSFSMSSSAASEMDAASSSAPCHPAQSTPLVVSSFVASLHSRSLRQIPIVKFARAADAARASHFAVTNRASRSFSAQMTASCMPRTLLTPLFTMKDL